MFVLDSSSPLSLQLMFLQLISCLQTKRHVPTFVLELSKKAASLKAPGAAYIDQLTETVAKLCNLRADIASKSISENSEIFSAACSIECELSAWVNSLPSTWAYTTNHVSQGNHKVKADWNGLYPYNGRYHVYGDLWMCNAWNNYRAARILVNEIILTRLRLMHSKSTAVSLSSEFEVQCTNIRSTLRQLAADVCYSVPYACGNVSGADHIDVDDISIPKPSIGGFIILWPLFLAASVDGWDRMVGEWCLECFRWIGRTLGIGLALAMIEIIRMNTAIVRWMDDMHQEAPENTSEDEGHDLSIENGQGWWDWEMVGQDMQLCIRR